MPALAHLPDTSLVYTPSVFGYADLVHTTLGEHGGPNDGMDDRLLGLAAASTAIPAALVAVDDLLGAAAVAHQALQALSTDDIATLIAQAQAASDAGFSLVEAALTKLSLTPGTPGLLAGLPAAPSGSGGGIGSDVSAAGALISALGKVGLLPSVGGGSAAAGGTGAAGLASVASGFAAGFALPLIILSLMGINPFSSAPSAAQIATDRKTALPLVKPLLDQLAGWILAPGAFSYPGGVDAWCTIQVNFLNANHLTEYIAEVQNGCAQLKAAIAGHGDSDISRRSAQVGAWFASTPADLTVDQLNAVCNGLPEALEAAGLSKEASQMRNRCALIYYRIKK